MCGVNGGRDDRRQAGAGGRLQAVAGVLKRHTLRFLSMRTVRHKKLSPAALAFKDFLGEQGGVLMDSWS